MRVGPHPGHLFPKPKVISLLQQGEDPWKVEKESPGGSSLEESRIFKYSFSKLSVLKELQQIHSD
ncbi:hypothetical protein E5288_WYG002357 [Bos mutus]|uniref:KRAB domain-containing protein n=1 Tax=Bos mutus TaxID=72004 RepID=A0A6B0R5D0_9CETA|nr:hypothetical protein [Bos mutus]